MLIRIGQCARRYADTKQAYPHIANLFKYVSSFPATFVQFSFASKDTRIRRIVQGLKIIETIYKMY